MGLDIYFYKTKPSEGVNITSVEEVSKDYRKIVKTRVETNLDNFGKRISESSNNEERNSIIDELVNYCKEEKFYEFEYSMFKHDMTTEDVRTEIKKLKQWIYPREDVYFRKANFVYAFFSPYLEDERCMVSKDIVNELLEKCNIVIDAARKDGLIKEDELDVVDGFYFPDGYNWLTGDKDETEKIQKGIDDFIASLPTNWQTVAAKELPTQEGFFFGSTDYTPYYLSDVCSCIKRFTELMNNWKDDEVVYCTMSW